MKALAKSALALTALLTAFGQPASAARVTWNMAGPLPESNFLTQNLRFFVKRVDELSKGEFKINLHVANALVKDQETKQAVRAGQVPIAEMYIYVYGNENPVFDASTLPFIAGTGEKAFKLWTLTKPHVESLLAKQHIKLLYTTPWPMQGFYTNKPITSMDDFKGLKSRVYSTKTARLAQLMGAEPVQVVMSEIAQAFATGLVQTMYTSPQAGVQSQAWDFAKYYTFTSGGHRPMNAVIVNQRFYDQLPEEFKTVLREAALDAQTRGWLESETSSTEHIKELKAHGMIIQDPSPEFMAQLGKIGIQMLEEWAAQTGELGQTVLKEFGKK
jgi:TRAP-type C4-dicarboxylate transport system substrate-binding protein